MYLKTAAITLGTTLALTLAPGARAQAAPGSEPTPRISINANLAMQAKTGMIGMRTDNLEVSPVKNSPFCATITTEHTQIFGDGNRIHTTENSTLCRDSEGRTRREAELNLLGAVSQPASQKIITIIDPVAGLRYMLDANEKTARKSSFPQMNLALPAGAKVAGQQSVYYVRRSGGGGDGDVAYATADAGSGAQVFVRRIGPHSPEAAPATENLGDQTIAGVHVTGTRVTTTIPAGTMGNDQPISVVSESWFSPELKTTIMTKHTDPWAGELKTQFMNVSTAPPDQSLFTVPADYKIVEEKTTPFTIKLQPRHSTDNK